MAVLLNIFGKVQSVKRAYAFCGFKTVDHGHGYVHKHRIKFVYSGGGKNIYCFLTVKRRYGFGTRLPCKIFGYFHIYVVILGNQNSKPFNAVILIFGFPFPAHI